MSADIQPSAWPSPVVLGANTSEMEKEAVFGDVFCSLLECPPALRRVGAEIKDLSLGVLHHTQRGSEERLATAASVLNGVKGKM